MRFVNWLIINKNGIKGVRKAKTDLAYNEIACKIQLDIPKELFERPKIEATLKIDNIPNNAYNPDIIINTKELLDGFKKCRGEKDDLYKATYMQNPCNILTEENLNILENNCKKAIHYERGEIKREHEVILELLYKYKEQQEQKESQNKIIDLIEEDLHQLATAINEEYHVEEYLLNKETIKKYYERKVANEKE